MHFQILKREINVQETCEINDLLEMDYPPKVALSIQNVPNSPVSEPLYLHVEGLDEKIKFILYPGVLDINHTIIIGYCNSRSTCKWRAVNTAMTVAAQKLL